MTRYNRGDLDAILNYPDDPDPVAAELARRITEAGFANVQADPGGALCVIAYLSGQDAREFLRNLERKAAHSAEDPITPASEALTGEVFDNVDPLLPGSLGNNERAALFARIRESAENQIQAVTATAVTAERARITALFSDWIEILMSEPDSRPPAAWKTAFADLIATGD